jgi:hypothetical protein
MYTLKLTHTHTHKYAQDPQRVSSVRRAQTEAAHLSPNLPAASPAIGNGGIDKQPQLISMSSASSWHSGLSPMPSGNGMQTGEVAASRQVCPS